MSWRQYLKFVLVFLGISAAVITLTSGKGRQAKHEAKELWIATQQATAANPELRQLLKDISDDCADCFNPRTYDGQ